MPTINIILHPINKDADGKRKIVLRFTQNRIKYFIDLDINIRFSKEQFEGGQIKSRSGIKEVLRQQINSILSAKFSDANRILVKFQERNIPITYERFKRELQQTKTQDHVFPFFDQLIIDYEAKARIGNAGIYRTVKNSLKKYKTNSKLRFSDVDYRFLAGYETYLFKEGLKGNGISLYMRTLRAAFNKAIKHEITDPGYYPFRNQVYPNGYKISDLETETPKRAISLNNIRAIEQTETKPLAPLHDSKCYFIFSFYCRGMNFTDMAYLKNENIQDNHLAYTRAKTRHKQRFTIEILPPVQEIIDYFKHHPGKGNYILPILNDAIYKTPKQKMSRIQTILKRTNRNLKDLGENAGIDAELTTYVARHSWATILKEMGTPTAAIGDGLGHTNSETTERYLRKFENNYLDEINKKLLK